MPTPTVQATSPARLIDQLRALPHGSDEDIRGQVVPGLKAWRDGRLASAEARFTERGHADRLVVELSGVMDEVIVALFALLMPGPMGVSVVATGGYGRAELFPQSDIDLLFLYRPAARSAAERFARTLLYVLWDLGLKVGHALRGVEDTLELACGDLTIRTNLIDARLIAGDAGLFGDMSERFAQEVVEGTAEAFVEAKLAERDARHKRFGDSRYLLEPNIKDGKGGLRDLHTLYWIARYVYGIRDIEELAARGWISAEEAQAFAKARAFLWELRAHLHYVAGKPEERLTFDKQQALAPRMGYRDHAGTKAVERLMKRYFMTASSVGSLTRIVCAMLEEQHKRKPRQPLAKRLQSMWKLDGFIVEGERLSVKSEDEFAREPIRMLKLFAIAQKYNYDVHPHALQQVGRNLNAVAGLRDDPKAGALFLEMLLSKRGPEVTLSRMNEVGLLGRFIPEFGRIVGQMQFNMYHIYTVDEHTIVALGILAGIDNGKYAEEMPLATEIAKRISSRRVLYVSLLCHDIAKGRGTDHSEEGAKIVLKLARRLGLTASEAEAAAWLVKHHLLMTHTAFKRDANDPQTVRDFAEAVQSLERLRLLLLLTVSDMRAVGPGIWNAWKANLLRSLFRRAERYIQTGMIVADQEEGALQLALAQALPEWSDSQIEAYLALCPPDYLASLEPATLARVATLLREGQALKIDYHHDAARGMTELIVVAEDQHALFSKLSGAISLSGGNIVGAKIFTLKNGMAVDVFQLQDYEGKPFDKPERLQRMTSRLQQAVSGQLDLEKELARSKPNYPTRRDAFQVEGQVFIENEVSATHTVVEVVGRDRAGFLYAVTHTLSEQGLSIGSAHISTYGAQAVDVFYVKDGFGHKVTHEGKLMQLRSALLAAIGEVVEQPAPPPSL